MNCFLRFLTIIVVCSSLSSMAFSQWRTQSSNSPSISSSQDQVGTDAMSDVPPTPSREGESHSNYEYSAPNAIYLELGGTGLIYTLNYERLVDKHLGLRIGFGYLGLGVNQVDNGDGTTSSVNASITAIPVTLSWFPFSNIGSIPSSKFELGAGICYLHLTASTAGASAAGSTVAIDGIVGYRYQPADGGFLFRAAFTPYLIKGMILPWAGISFGLGF